MCVGCSCIFNFLYLSIMIDSIRLFLETHFGGVFDHSVIPVRQLERMLQTSVENQQKKKDEKIDNYFVEMEISLNERLGRRVKVDYGRNKGALILEFYNKEDLAALAEKLTVEE